MIEDLIERLYEAASMNRWNDHIRPVELTELDKQAHKMVLAYVIAKFEEKDRNADVNWQKLIEGGIFEFLHRTILTDLKPPIFHKMMEEKAKDLNDHVISKLKGDFKGLKPQFEANFKRYLFDTEYSKFERKILKAAHYLATNWEFRIIYHSSPFIYGIEDTKAEIENQIEDHYDLIGVQKLSLEKKSFGFIDLCGQLRFQERWAHSPRVPKTSVLGHMYIVAITSYLFSLENEACPKRLYNNFFAGLFHDLPEVLTKDIISPVKSSVKGLEDLIKEFEENQMKTRLLPLLPVSWRREMNYFTKDEFVNKVRVEDSIKKGIDFKEINRKYNKNEYYPLDGELIKACDKLAAFIEADLSIKHGITSKKLEEGRMDIYKKFKGKKISGIDFGYLFDYFFKRTFTMESNP
ncbi:HAD superfamily hydrolase [Methanobacterium lacus]|jgi:putative hydrolases of HD superfamily|uniref:HAD superfamily hydrolase n=1 Tax=Methanobacterium lacus (strain AL-21) TaxID=877455 RepID=F0T7A3_METLA|nr:HD domain-containing protein [Methanobacterium lacus]ADZ08332.1 HAD superfamily hydrolase [Methanobacterium lacus]